MIVGCCLGAGSGVRLTITTTEQHKMHRAIISTTDQPPRPQSNKRGSSTHYQPEQNMKNRPVIEEESLVCPITGEIMVDPVVDHEGHSYEKEAILEWLSDNQVSPITRNPLTPAQLSPNHALRNALGSQPSSPGAGTATTVPDFDVSLTSLHKQDGHCLLQVHVSDDATRAHVPAAVVCVLDVSYSMDDAAVMHDDTEGNAGLSLLDIVKHATRTVIETLDPEDRLAIVTYADRAEVVLPFTPMTAPNKTKAWNIVEELSTCGSTNIWDGLVKAMDLSKIEEEHVKIILLTDGLPNVRPPRGELESLVRFKERNPSLKATISTFGFGYNLDSKLLRDIAVEGGGHFCFIPDSSFVGTVFVNATANILSVAQTPSTLELETVTEGAHIKNLSGLHGQETSWGLSIQVPQLLYGQTLDVLVRVEGSCAETSPLKATLKNGQITICSETDGRPATSENDTDSVMLATARSKVIELVNKAQDDLNGEEEDQETKKYGRRGRSFCNKKSPAQVIKSQTKAVKSLSGVFHEFGESASVKALEQDLTGQIREALSRQSYYDRWGRHYLFSLARAHELQQCTNFKDPGVQIYATKKFMAIRDESEDKFCELPPPTPSRKQQTTNYAPVRSMSAYYDCHAPCFAEGNVRLADGRYVGVSRIRAGDIVATPKGPVKVKCVVKTECDDGIEELVTLKGGVVVTPWHPVREIGSEAWSFPADMAPSVMCLCTFVYSFVLENREPLMQIGPYQAVTLGHGIEDDPVAKHDYLGTSLVLDDLSKMKGWEKGLVELSPNPVVRDETSHLIVALRQAPQGRTNLVDAVLNGVSLPNTNNQNEGNGLLVG
mmetsp:Transcript_5811/g.12904  ORF Transcript_5811/g.12904 Transcript_5811/m.12904 type:complete len:833 (+) Transcript_5811:293-2791(+)